MNGHKTNIKSPDYMNSPYIDEDVKSTFRDTAGYMGIDILMLQIIKDLKKSYEFNTHTIDTSKDTKTTLSDGDELFHLKEDTRNKFTFPLYKSTDSGYEPMLSVNDIVYYIDNALDEAFRLGLEKGLENYDMAVSSNSDKGWEDIEKTYQKLMDDQVERLRRDRRTRRMIDSYKDQYDKSR